MSARHATAARTHIAPRAAPPVMRRSVPQSSYAPPPFASLGAIPAAPTVQRKCTECEREDERSPVQPRLEVGPVGDRYEQEADSIAARVMAMPAPEAGASPAASASAAGGAVQRACSACASSDDEPRARRFAEPKEEEQDPMVRARRDGGDESIAASDSDLTSGGSALPGATRSFFESRMGRDLGDVRVHQGSDASAKNDSISARAFTYKNHVWLGANESASPSFTMAHELAHVMQQTAPGVIAPRVQRDGMGDVRIAEGREEQERQQRLEQSLGILPMLVRWKAAGLLDPPYRPANVAEIPAMEFTPERAKAMQTQMAGLPALAYVAGEVAKTALTKPGPALTLLQGGAGAAAEVGTAAATDAAATGAAARGASLLGGALRVAAPIGIAATILLYSSPTAPAWMDTLSQITGGPYGSPEEYRWERRLDKTQQDYLKELWRHRRAKPDSSLDSAPDAEPQPVPVPKPKTKKDRDTPTCKSSDVPRRGGHQRHDAYADKVTGSKADFFAQTPGKVPIAINYDGKTPASILVWEVKVGHGWFHNPDYAALRDLTLAKWDAQRARGLIVAQACGFQHFWSIPDKWIAGWLQQRWQGAPAVLNIPEK